MGFMAPSGPSNNNIKQKIKKIQLKISKTSQKNLTSCWHKFFKTLHDSSSLNSSSSISCVSSVQVPKELVEEQMSNESFLEKSTSTMSALASVAVSVSDDLLQGRTSALVELSSNDGEKLLHDCTIISLLAVTAGWLCEWGVEFSSLLELLLEASKVYTDQPELSDDWLARDERFEPSWSASVSMPPATRFSHCHYYKAIHDLLVWGLSLKSVILELCLGSSKTRLINDLYLLSESLELLQLRSVFFSDSL